MPSKPRLLATITTEERKNDNEKLVYSIYEERDKYNRRVVCVSYKKYNPVSSNTPYEKKKIPISYDGANVVNEEDLPPVSHFGE